MPIFSGVFSFNLLVVIFLRFKFLIGVPERPLLLVVSLDGLRYDFIRPDLTPNIWHLAQRGVFAPHGISPQVLTVTSPNHQSIATGLYQESHGIIDNTFYDPIFKEFFDNWNFSGNATVAERSLLAHWYADGGEPIWRTNMQIDGHCSGSLNWPLANAQFVDNYTKMHKFTVWKDYGNFNLWTQEIEKLLAWFTNEDDPINFGLYYNAQPDHAEHLNDIEGPEVKKMLSEIDNLIGYLIDRLNDTKLINKINLILTADHGHVNIFNSTYLFNLSRYLDPKQILKSGPSLFPAENSLLSENEIFANLTRAIQDGVQIRIWKKTDFPDRYHYKRNRRVGPIIVMYDIHHWNDPQGHMAAGHFPFGQHGYLTDFDEMRPFFLAFGPAFRKNYLLMDKSIQNVDLYPLMCFLLGVKPAPNNGSFERIAVIFDSEYLQLNALHLPLSVAPASSRTRTFLFFLCLIIPAIFVVAICFALLSRGFGRSLNHYTRVSQEGDSAVELISPFSLQNTDNFQ